MKLFKEFILLLLLTFTFQVSSQEVLRSNSFNGVNLIIKEYKVNDSISSYEFIISTSLNQYDYTIFREKDEIRYRTAGDTDITQTFRVYDKNKLGLKGIYLKVVTDSVKIYDIYNEKEVN